MQKQKISNIEGKSDEEIAKLKSEKSNFMSCFLNTHNFDDIKRPVLWGDEANKPKEKGDLIKVDNCIEKEFDSCSCEKILVVDDDPFNLLCMEIILKKLDLKCCKALNGKEAINKIEKQKCNSINCSGFTLIFLDYHMPMMDGFECAKEIIKMKNEKQEKQVPLIFCSAYCGRDIISRAINDGFKDVLTKPIVQPHLIKILYKWFW